MINQENSSSKSDNQPNVYKETPKENKFHQYLSLEKEIFDYMYSKIKDNDKIIIDKLREEQKNI